MPRRSRVPPRRHGLPPRVLSPQRGADTIRSWRRCAHSHQESVPETARRRLSMAQTAQLRVIHSAENECERIFNLQREAYLRHPYPSVEERRANLARLEQILV